MAPDERMRPSLRQAISSLNRDWRAAQFPSFKQCGSPLRGPLTRGRHGCGAGWNGAVAQLGERVVRNDEVRGSIPLGSTILPVSLWNS